MWIKVDNFPAATFQLSLEKESEPRSKMSNAIPSQEPHVAGHPVHTRAKAKTGKTGARAEIVLDVF